MINDDTLNVKKDKYLKKPNWCQLMLEALSTMEV